MRIYVAGHRGLVGSALVRAIDQHEQHTWIGATRSQLNLQNKEDVGSYISENQPDAIIIAAAKVGGIGANSKFPVEFLLENLEIQNNLISAAYKYDVKKLVFLGSSCIYPKFADQPIKESALLTGVLEPTNEAYAIAKIAGIKLVQSYRNEYGRSWVSAMPTNLYGLEDNFDIETSHVLPAMIAKFHKAKVENLESVELWGTGNPRREFLHVDDLATAILHVLDNYDDGEPINIGTGIDIKISELAQVISEIVGFQGTINWNSEMPDGTPRKVLDTSKINALGWYPKISLKDGISYVYSHFSKSN